MQQNAIYHIYNIERQIKQSGDIGLIGDWRKLQTSDHFYYMCTKWFADGDVHKYFNPYDTPYDSYINFMMVLDNLRSRCAARGAGSRPRSDEPVLMPA
jgi:alpha-amylase